MDARVAGAASQSTEIPVKAGHVAFGNKSHMENKAQGSYHQKSDVFPPERCTEEKTGE